MKIYFLTTKLDFSNSGGSMMELDLIAKTLQQFGNEVSIITIYSHANSLKPPPPYSVIEDRVFTGRQIGLQIAALRLLKKYENEADAFLVDGHIFLYGAGLYRRLSGKRPVVGLFNRELTCWPINISEFFVKSSDSFWIILKKKLRFYIEKYLLTPFTKGLDAALFTNPVLQKEYENFRVKPRKTFIIGDPFDYKNLMKEFEIGEDSYKKRNKTKGPITLFYSSRMAPGKGFDLLLLAFSKVRNKENFKLILGGTGPEEQMVHQMVKDLKLDSYIVLPGWVPRNQLYEFYKTADIFIQPRWRQDMTSMSLLQAMTFGIPSILPGGGGLEWDAKKSALYFKDGNAEDFAKRIEELGSSFSLREELSKQCYVRLHEEQMDYRKQIKRIEEAMQGI